MKIFLDTSSLIKLYHREADTHLIEEIFKTFEVKEIFLSEILQIEFTSAIYKKVRTKELTEIDAIKLISMFIDDFIKYTFIKLDNVIMEEAKQLISKYGLKGLRTLDSIQLACSVLTKNLIDLFLTSDKLLNLLFQEEGLVTELPQT